LTACGTIFSVFLSDSLNVAKSSLKRVTLYLELEVVFIEARKHFKLDLSLTRQPKHLKTIDEYSESTDLIFGAFIKIFFS
jgi:hypothetical protein